MAIGSYNRPPNVLTTNEHYLSANFNAMLAKEQNKGADDRQAILEVAYRIHAYLKTQRKMLEVASKEFILILNVKLNKMVMDLLAKEETEWVVYVDTKDIEEEKKRLANAKRAFEKALALLNPFIGVHSE